MATVLDAFIVTLGLDPKGFKQGSAEVQKEREKMEKGARRQDTEEGKRAKQRELEAKKALQAIVKIKNEVLGMAAAFVSASGIKSFVEKITASDAAVGRLSKNLGMSVKDLSAFKGAAEKMGGTGEDMEAAFRNINWIVQDFKLHGGSDAQTPLGRAGLDIDKFLAKSTTMEQRLRMLADAYKKLSPQDAQSLGGEAGFTEGAINVLMQGTEALDAQVTAQRKANVVSEADTAAAKRRVDAWSKLGDSLEEVGRKITTWLTPALEYLLRVLTEHPEAILAVGGIATALSAVAAISFTSTIAGIGGVAAATTAAGVATAGVLGILSKVVLTMAAIWSVTQIYRYLEAVKELRDVRTREGVKLTPEAQARVDRGDTRTGGASDSWDAPDGAAAASGTTRGMRNNNPGNLNFVGQEGATKETGPGGRFAVFQSMEHGVVALAKQLQLYASRGNDTVRGIISKYAPPGENNTAAYIGSMTKRMGVGADQHLDLSNIAVLREVISGISTVENGAGRLGIGQINSGLAMFQAGRGRGGSGGGGGTSTTDVKIGNFTIQTQATDAKGIAIDFGSAVNEIAISGQANSGQR